MLNISPLLERIPDEFKPLAALGIGASILIFLVLFHGTGLHGILVLQGRGEQRLRSGRPLVAPALFLFGWTVFLLLTLHLAEIVLWALFLTRLGLIVRDYNAIYFCANAYTNLGYGNVDLGPHWRNIAPIMGISGLFTFAWTTSALVTVVGGHRQLMNQVEHERKQEALLAVGLVKDEWKLVHQGREAERRERAQARAQDRGASFLQRCRMWREDKKREAQIFRMTVDEIKELRRKIRRAEEDLEAQARKEESGDAK